MDSLPNTLIIGAAKAGTTTLYDLLKQHPQVFLSFDKEPMFFSRDDFFFQGVEWYTQKFFDGSDNYPVRGEATPHYLYWAKKVSPRIKETYNNRPPKFIVILRNPIERAYSWYWNMVSEGREKLSFLDALLAEESRIRDNWTELEYFGWMKYGYFRGGCYASQIQNFFENFPKDRFYILLQEDLIRDQRTSMKNIFNFLGVNPKFDITPGLSNPSAAPRIRSLHMLIRNPSQFKDFLKPFLPDRFRHEIKSMILKNNIKRFRYPEMESRAYSYLKEKFAFEIASLSVIIERDLSHWIK